MTVPAEESTYQAGKSGQCKPGVRRPTAVSDFDGDGQSNEAEWLALTDPASAASTFQPVITPGPGGPLLSFPTAPGRMYHLRRSGDLVSWEDAPVPPVSGDGTFRTFPLSSDAARRFYRVAPSQPGGD